jgi:hydrogenase maturation protease
MTTPGRVVVIGVGNPFRGDDGAGPEVARLLRGRLPREVEVLEHDGDPAGLLHGWEDARLAYVVDAVRDGGPAGAVHRLELAADDTTLPPAGRRDSSHALGLGEAVQLARVLGRLPERLVLVGITGDCFDTGAPLGDPVRRAVATVADDLAKEVAAWCA